MAAKRPTGKGAIKATAMSLAVAALQDEEVQRRLKAAGAVGLARLKAWNREHGPALSARGAGSAAGSVAGAVGGAVGDASRRASRQGRLEVRVERLADSLDGLRDAGQFGARLDWLGQTLDEAETALVIARGLPRDKRKAAHDKVDSLLTDVEDALVAALPAD